MTGDDSQRTRLRLTSFKHFAYIPQFVALGIKAFEIEQLEVTLIEHTGSWSGLIEAAGGGASDVILGNIWFALQQTRQPNLLIPVAHCMQQCRSLVLRRKVDHGDHFEWRHLEGSAIIVQNDVPTPWV